MRVNCIEESDENLGEVCCCPECDKPWLVLSEEGAEWPDCCLHLRFVVPPEAALDQVLYRNGMTRTLFVEEMEKNYRRLLPANDRVSAEEMFSAVLSEEIWEEGPWAQAEIAGVDTVVLYTQCGFGRSFTNVFGAKLGE